MRPDAGCIAIDGRTVFDAARRIDVPPQGRGVGLVVQDYALFPHLSVRDNIAFGLGRLTAPERRTRVAAMVSLLGLQGLEDRRPARISGGQAQRVALARALAPQPRLLLLDEPFSALDSAIRVGLRRELARLKRELDLTIVFVTHDLREAFNLADKIAVFDAGRVLQVDARDAVFDRPASARVAELTEVRNIWRGRVVAVEDGIACVDTGRFRLRGRFPAADPGAEVDACIRPERVVLRRTERAGDTAGETVLEGDLIDEIPHGASYTLFFRLADNTGAHDLEVDLPAMPYQVLGVRARRRWRLALPVDAVHIVPAE